MTQLYVYIDTGGAQNTGATSRDSIVDVLGTDGTTLIERDDDDGTGNGRDSSTESSLASVVANVTLPAAGTYYIRVSAFSGIINPYRMYATTSTSAGTSEVEPNDTSATATVTTATVNLGTLATTTDVDFYRVSLTAGTQIFVELDGDPERNGGTTASVNHIVAMLASDGTTQLIEADSANSTGSPAPPAEGFSYQIPTTGNYFLRVRTDSTSGEGTYRLFFRALGCGTPNRPSALSTFNGTNANGQWSLYVVDDAAPDGGSIAGGYRLTFNNNGELSFDNTNPITIPTSGAATPYPSNNTVSGVGSTLR